MHRFCVCALALAALCSTPFAQTDVPLKAQTLETDENGDGMPDGWAKYVSKGEGRVAVDRQIKRSGKGCLRIEVGDAGRCTVTQLVPLPKPGSYTFGCWVKTDLSEGSAHLYVQWRTLEGQIITSDTPSAKVSGQADWTHLAALATKPEEAASALLVIVVSAKQSGRAWADDAWLKRGAHPADIFRNPGFERGAEQPEGWGQAIYGEGFTLSRDVAQAHSGVSSAKLTAGPDPGSRACYVQVGAAMDAPRAVRLRLWYTGTGRAEGILRFRPVVHGDDTPDEYGTTHFRCLLPRDEWTQFVFEAGVPGAARRAGTFRPELILYQKAEGVLWYDDVSLEPLEKWTPKLTEAQSALMMPYRPADGKVVLQNPPDLSWPPQADAATYELQLSRDGRFPADACEVVAGLAYSVYSHNATLGEGVWHWRVRYSDDSGEPSEWGKPRTFTVTSAAKPFAVPRPDELLARIPAGHPRVYATAESIDDFRAPIEGSKKAWWETFRQAIDGYAQREVDPEPGPEFIDYRKAGLDDESVALGNKLRGYCSGVTSRTQQLAFGYLLSGQARYARAAITQMMQMASWDPQGATSYRNHDQVFRDITWKMACGYDWCWDQMTLHERDTIRQSVVTRAGILYSHFSESSRPIYEYPYDSHGITAYGFLGICAIALAHDSEQADEWFRFIAATYPAIFPPWGDEEGGWGQGVGYWKWSSPFAWWFYDALSSATGLDMYQKAWQRNSGWYKLYMHPPWCDRHHFGDGNHGAPGSTDQSNLAHLANVYDNPYFQWYAKSLPGWPAGGIYSYWWYDDSMPLRPPGDLPQGKYLPDIGWVAMHSDLSDPDDIMLMFKSSQFGSFNHSHADQNSFVVYGYGEPLLIDSGYYDWYGSPHDTGWTRQTKAHNCVLIDGQGQPIFDKTATGTVTRHFTSPHVDYTVGDATKAYKGKLSSFKRHILYLRPDTFLIYDELEAPQAGEFTWCAHAEGQMALNPDDREVNISRGEAGCLVKFICPQGLRFEQSNEFTPPPTTPRESEWHAYVSTTQKTKQARFVVLVRPYSVEEGAADVEPILMDTAAGFAVHDRRMGERLLAAATVEGEAIDFDQLDAVARMAALALLPDSRKAAGESRFVAAMVEGTQLRLGRRDRRLLLIDASLPVTAALETSAAPGTAFTHRVDYLAGEPTDLTILTMDEPIVCVMLDGAELSADGYAVDAEKQTVRLRAPAGRHIVQINPAVGEQTPEAHLNFELDGVPVELRVETMRTRDGGGLAWGSLAAPPGPVRARLQAPEGATVHIGRQTLREGDTCWLTPSSAVMVWTREPAEPVTVRLESLIADPEPVLAREVGDSVARAPGVLKYEAESFSAHGGGNARAYSHRTFLSAGQGVETAVVPGQWLCWEFDVPRAGVYNLILKGACHQANARRLIELDGKPILGNSRVLQFDGTGGFGATPAEWKHFLVCDDWGNPAAIALGPGRHQLRLTSVERKLNLDYFLLAPQADPAR